MGQRRPGRELAITLSESPNPVLEFFLWALFISGCLWWFGTFIRALITHSVGKNSGLLESLAGLLGIFLLFHVVRKAVLRLRAGPTRVEISQEPLQAGQRLDYVIEQTRPADATLICQQSVGRHSVETLIEVPLVVGGLKSVVIPDFPPERPRQNNRTPVWGIQVTIRFGPRLELVQWHPIEAGD